MAAALQGGARLTPLDEPSRRGIEAPRWLSAGSLSSLIAIFVMAVCVIIVGLEVWHARAERAAQVGDVESAASNLARSLSQHAEDTVEIANSVLSMLAERVGRADASGEDIAEIHPLLVQQMKELPRLSGLFVYDANGAWRVNSTIGNTTNLNNSDREYFIYHREHPGTAVRVGVPVLSRSTGRWIIPVSRRLDRVDGTFGGVVLATINVAYFDDFYRQFDVGKAGAVLLFSTSGLVLARYPGEQGFVGRDISRSALYLDHLSAGPAGNYHVKSTLDAVERIGAFQKGNRFPIGVAVSISEEEALAEWKASAAKRLAVTMILAVSIAAMGYLVMRQVWKQQSMRAALVDSEAKFRLIAENSSDVVTVLDSVGIRTYASPSSARVLGRTPEQLTGRSAFDMIDGEDREAVDAGFGRLQAGETDSATLIYRMLKPDGVTVWLESAVQIARDQDTGRLAGLVAVTRDITDRKALESRLAAQARTDGLTGLANRRELDERMSIECRRAARDGTPVSLVLFDLDRFKIYNDTYGHQAGDECLRRVASVIAANALRPADVAARYGGEELAILLPGTDAEGARAVAERIRSGVQDLSMRHSGNPPAAVVTLSGGVATLTELRDFDAAAPEALIGLADRALYEGKHAGRNRIVSCTDEMLSERRAAE